jgi:hypothetical protein
VPIVTIPGTITRPEHLVEYFGQLFEDNLSPPFQFISKYDEKLIPNYPCLQIQPGPTSKEYHSTSTFQLYLTIHMYIMHDTLTVSRRVRSLEDLQLATQVVEFLETDLTLGGRMIDGFVSDEAPAVVPPHSPKTPAMVSTRLTWVGKTQKRFKSL